MELPYKYYFFGSENSSDTDVLIEVDSIEEQHLNNDFIKKIKKEYSLDWDINLIVIRDGKITDTISRKGSPDNVNNSLFQTYKLHKQQFPNPITEMVERHHFLATFKCIRNILSFCSRTENRNIIKSVLKKEYYNSSNPSFIDFVEVLKKIDFTKIESFNKKFSDEDIWKKISFYLGQTLSLIKENNEIYTKNQLVSNYPHLKPFIERNIKNIQKHLINELRDELIEVVNEYEVEFIGGRKLVWNNEIIDIQFEKIIRDE